MNPICLQNVVRRLSALAILSFVLLAPQGARAAYQNMGGSRILLMNNDGRTATTGGLAGQGYYDTNSLAGTTYWVHEPWNDNTKLSTRYLLHGTDHVLHDADGRPLWHLVDCRAGHVQPGLAGRNYLPYSERHARESAPAVFKAQIESRTYTYYTNAANACVIMRNAAGAAIYSPVYKDGIGTIYFDAVNSFAADFGSSLELYVATNVTEEARGRGIAFADAGNDYARYDWRLTPMTVLGIRDGAVAETREGVTNLLLDVTDGGMSHWFRVRTQLNHYGPIRFCIRRSSVDEGRDQDMASLILVDNVVASFPPVTMKLNRYGGDCDPNLHGAEVQGMSGDFTVPFAAVGQTNLFTHFSIEWVTNFQGTSQKIVVQDPKIHYRWRYLSQKVTDWRELVLTPQKVTFLNTPDATQFVSQVSIPLSDGVGDLEYFYTLDIDSAPYYLPRDYANDSAVGFGTKPGSTEKWSEAIGVVTNRLSCTEPDALPSGGTDYFARIREGESDYEWVKLVASVSTNACNGGTKGLLFGKTTEARMELVGNHAWRYHYYVPTNMVGQTLRFHFQGRECVPDVNGASRSWIARTNAWYSDLSGGLSHLPWSGNLRTTWRQDVCVALDAASTHLLIEFDDARKRFSVRHASHQDFNLWTDALDGFHSYTACSGEPPDFGAPFPGLSEGPAVHVAKMSDWDTTASTDDFRREAFANVAVDDPRYPYGVHQTTATAPNGWSVENGAFVPGRRGLEYNEEHVLQKSLAWRMDGHGKGAISLTRAAVPGVGEMKFAARVSQNPSFENFATYLDGNRCTNYAVSAQLTMSRLYAMDKCPLDISPAHPSVSLVGYHRASKGCYELRFVRVDETHLGAELWKWTQGDGEMASSLLASNLLYTAGNSRPGPGQSTIGAFSNLLVPQSEGERDSYWTSAMFSLYTSGDTVKLDGWLSRTRNMSRIDQDTANLQNVIHFEDGDPGELKRGSYGVGSCDCQAAFGQMQCHSFAGNLYTGSSSGRYGVIMTGWSLAPDFMENWNLPGNRWRQLTATESPQWRDTGLAAVIPQNQTVELFLADRAEGPWRSSGCVANVASFATNRVSFRVNTSADAFVQLRTGMDEAAIAVDDVEVTAWTAEDRGSENYFYFDEWTYTRAVIEATADIRGGEVDVYPAGTNGYVYAFTTPGQTIEFTPKADMVVDRLLLVGGGGAGGWTIGGGGGGGGVLDVDFGATNAAVTLKAGEIVRIVVGRGGDNYYVDSLDSTNWRSGGAGGSSTVFNFGGAGKNYSVKGGGGGATWFQRTAASGYATGGGSAQGISNGYYSSRAAGTADQGNSGGRAYGDRAGGGGGASLDVDGEGQDGNAVKNGAGDGGAGRMSDITGCIAYYGGGGGGGGGNGSMTPDSAMGGAGGIGGGGDGLKAAARDRTVQSTCGSEVDGTDGLGGGGGGGSHGGAVGTYAGGRGGSGVVMFRVRTDAKVCTLQPARGVIQGAVNGEGGLVEPMGLRSPYLVEGLSTVSFDYLDADTNCVLWLQVCTNCTHLSGVGGLTVQSPEWPDGDWHTVCVWAFPGARKNYPVVSTGSARDGIVTNHVFATAGGTLTHFMNVRAPVSALVRVVMAPEVVRAGVALSRTDETYGRISISGASCRDNSKGDERSWWGWNLHTEGWNTHDKAYAYLADSPAGLSCMLNFSALAVDNNVPEAKGIGLAGENVAEFAKNNPFVQCPPLTNGIGAVSFRARTFSADQPGSSWVTLYGSVEPDAYQPDEWEKWMSDDGTGRLRPLAEFEITNDCFRTFSWTAPPGLRLPHAVRIEVNAARFGRDGAGCNLDWERPQATPVNRVVLDEVSVSECLEPRFAFAEVRPFRGPQLRAPALASVSNILFASAQPIVGEDWGLQATVEVFSGEEAFDLDSMRVFASFHQGESPWGYALWAETERIVELPRMGDSLVFRSHVNRPASIFPPVGAPATVQYMVWAECRDRAGAVHTNWLKRSEWTLPSWHAGLEDFNAKFGNDLPERFSAYTLFDVVAPRQAWINEVNYRNSESGSAEDGLNQYVEIAVPEGVDLTGWSVRVTGNSTYENAELAVFGQGGATTASRKGARQEAGGTPRYALLTLMGPQTRDGVTRRAADGVWNPVTDPNVGIENGVLRSDTPYGIALVRPNGVVEHEVVVEGCNVRTGTFLERYYSGTNLVAGVRAARPDSTCFFAGQELADWSVGVFRGRGEDASCWTNRMVLTPGLPNRLPDGTLQTPPDGEAFLPSWTVEARTAGGHVRILDGDRLADSLVSQVADGGMVRLLFHADAGYGVTAVAVDGKPAGAAVRREDGVWEFVLPCVGADCQVVASATWSRDFLPPDGSGNALVAAVARQRAPWNGLVDVDLEILGCTNATGLAVGLSASVLLNGRDLPLAAVTLPAASHGVHRLTGDAGAACRGLPAGDGVVVLRIVAADGTVVSETSTPPFQIDPMSGTGVRRVSGPLDLTYSALWNPGAATASVTANGTVLGAASGEGVFAWTPERAGVTNELVHLSLDAGGDVVAREVARLVADGPSVEIVSPADGDVVGTSQKVVLRGTASPTMTNGAVRVYYTLDGSEPTEESTLYEGAFKIKSACSIRAVAVAEGYPPSAVAGIRCYAGACEDVALSRPAGSYRCAVFSVELSCPTEGAAIHYTLDGSEPTEASPVYTSPIEVADTVTIRAAAFGPDLRPSSVVTATYVRLRALGDALDAPRQEFSTDSSLGWSLVSADPHEGVDCLRSGRIGDGGSCRLWTRVEGAGTVTFWWRASCERDAEDRDFDYGVFRVDGEEALDGFGMPYRLDGITGWERVSMELKGEGGHLLEWLYCKDESEYAGEDCVWLDGFTWSPRPTASETVTTEVPVPYAWLDGYPSLMAAASGDYEAAAKMETGKCDAAGRPMQAWQDYVAGTDPTVLSDVFRAEIRLADGGRVVTWRPDLNEGGTRNVRVYTVWGSPTLVPAAWHSPTNAADRFFKVSVEMPK